MICTNCPRKCNTDRINNLGHCKVTSTPEVASICIHKGEEPPISGQKGICNIFFAHCNLNCCYCQNHDISSAYINPNYVFYNSMEDIVKRIVEILPLCDNIIGLVSPTQYNHLIPELIERIREHGKNPTVVYNSNGYDNPTQLRTLAPYIDIYLPDYKYADPEIAQRYSNAYTYPEKVIDSLKEMYYQKGSSLITDENGTARQGMIIRHLVLPNNIDNSKRVLESIADNLSTNIHISLMSQYFPPKDITLPDELKRRINKDEYESIVNHFENLGFHNGWIQDPLSAEQYKPNFSKRDAF